MNDQMQPSPNYHVLLIGIDAYSVKPLHGCVNDIDAIQRLLLDKRVAIPKESITRLASPHPQSTHEATVDSQPATLANICTALECLGSNQVKEGDRVFIYYSGHGTRTPVRTAAGIFHREALVPIDFNAQPGTWQLLFDFDLNRLLAAIVARTSAVTAVLDCCNSAGATREVPASNMTSRVMDFVQDFGRAEPLSIPREKEALAAAGVRGVAGNVDDCHVVAACLNHELAQESTGSDGVRHGLLTRAVVEQLCAVPVTNLREVPWGRIWQAVRASVETANSAQHVWMAGNIARAVIAGPRVDGDMGLTIRRTGVNAYAIDAGTLAGLTKGAKVAIYRGMPPRFPPLGSDQDKQARLTDVLLEVTEAARASATAVATGTPFELPPGVRGRLVESGKADRLRCAVVPRNDNIPGTLASSALLEVVDEGHAEVLLRKQSDDTWALVDDIHGAKPDYPVLCRLDVNQLDLAARVMEQYFYYSLPLRMAVSCKDLPGALQINLLCCPKDRALAAAEQDGIGLPEVGSDGAFTYDLRAGDNVAIRIRNGSNERLTVTLLNAAASGRVEYLGDQIVDAKAHYILWHANTRGNPFLATTPKGADQGIDRLVAIGTTAYGKDLRYLKLDSTFADIFTRTRGVAKDLGDADSSRPPIEQWTATQAVVRCRA
jgi:caspase domain-containing protein